MTGSGNDKKKSKKERTIRHSKGLINVKFVINNNNKLKKGERRTL